ncbi:SAM-dependent methyltransferase [Dactylosporangium sp. CS-047395]|uniref:SAM-dependent methyltransferase n=1 Tax=Dactylosporangium sp. CS-047395 TaxID=3239936 RepID=UPI003D8E24BB
MTAVGALARPDRYPRSSRYDPVWLLDLDMGPNPLWMLEDLANDLDLRPGMQVLDLGSGKGATSVFLAREYGVQVVAADWWIAPDEAARVFADAGVSAQVTAVRAEAHNLPFAKGGFDAIVSIDAFEYFGTSDWYLPYLVGFLKPGGQLGMATPGMTREIRELGGVPAHLKELFGWEPIAWHTPEWWRFQWEVTELVTVTSARLQEDGWRDWLLWTRALAEHAGDATGREPDRQAVIDLLTADAGELLGLTLVTAKKR